MQLEILRKELAQARWREQSLLGVVSVANLSQTKFLSDGPFNPSSLKVFKEKNLSSDSLKIGYSLFLVSGITPRTEDARQSGCTHLLHGLRWATQRSQSVSTVQIETNFTTQFMNVAKEIANQSPAACAVLMGITVEEAHEVAKTSTDRMTLCEFGQHFDIKLRLRGDDRRIDDAYCATTQKVLCDYLKTSGVRAQRRERQRLLRTMFATRPLFSGRSSEMTSEQVQRDLRDLSQFFTELSVGQALMHRLFLLYPIAQRDACRLALKLRRQMNSEVDGRSTVHRAPPQGEVKELLLHQIQGTVLDALCCRFTATDLILVFFVAVLVSVRAQNIDVVTEHEAFWLMWAEKRLSNFLQRLSTVEPPPTNAEGAKSSTH